MGKVIMSGRVPKLVAPVTIPRVLNDATWEQIRQVADAGEAANYFSVGDTKTITINGKVGYFYVTDLSIDVFILGFDHNSEVEGTNCIHFGLGKINGTDVAIVSSNYGNSSGTHRTGDMNTTATNSGGWASCTMRSATLGSDSDPTNPTADTLLAAFPADLRAVMKGVTKYTDNTGGGSSVSSNITATTDYLWLLAEFEVFGTRSNANKYEKNYQAQYDYYKAGNSKIKYKHDDNATAAAWHSRSPYYSNSTGFCLMGSAGNALSGNANYRRGIAPAFCVGGGTGEGGDSGTTEPTTATVEITGTGHSSRCYATINGTQYTAATSGIEVQSGDVITFCIFTGGSDYSAGFLRINSSNVATIATVSANTETYDWTVPSGVSTITIELDYVYYTVNREGSITVTTA